MLRSVSSLRTPMYGISGLARTVVRQQRSLAKTFVEIVEAERPPRNETIVEKDGKVEKYLIDKEETANRLHVNLEGLSRELQTVFVKNYVDDVKRAVAVNDVKSISLNNISEDVFRYHINMPVRKLGFQSRFQRYNDDRGLASFIKNVENNTLGYKATTRLQRTP